MIDLNKLEAGDSIKLGDGETILLLEKIDTGEDDYPIELVLYFSVTKNRKHEIQIIPFTVLGESPYGDFIIVEIIKNPKRWTDEDMINAFNAASWNDISSDSLTTEQWLEQYKAGRK